MDKVFKELIDRNVEVYVDDIVVKSEQVNNTFKTYKKSSTRLGR